MHGDHSSTQALSSPRLDIAVIVPTYGRQIEVNRALRSALGQSLKPREVILVDDGSPVPVRIDDDISTDVRIVRLPRNCGAAAARNAGVEAATSEWIAFLDSDDEWLPEKLERQSALLTAMDLRQVGALCSGWRWRLTSPDRSRHEAEIPQGSQSPQTQASGCWFSPGSTLLLPRSTFYRVGPFDEALRRLEDYEWFIRFGLEGGRLAVCPQALAVIEPGRRADPRQLADAANRIGERYAGHPQIGKRIRAVLDYERAAASYHQGNPLRTFFFLVRSLAAEPRTKLYHAAALRRRVA